MHSAYRSDRSANEDHVLQQTDVTGVGKVPMLARGSCLCRWIGRQRCGETKASGGQSVQLGQGAQEAKSMLGIVFLLPPHLNIGSQLCMAVALTH